MVDLNKRMFCCPKGVRIWTCLFVETMELLPRVEPSEDGLPIAFVSVASDDLCNSVNRLFPWNNHKVNSNTIEAQMTNN